MFFKTITNFKEKLIRLDLKYYWLWAFLRVLLTILPQTGYIHPDEFFQSVEVFAGSAFGLQVSPPWEFNATNPIRSIPVVYLTTSLPLTFLKYLSFFTGPFIVSPYTILLVPRLSLCFLSFVSDYCLYWICFMYGLNFRRRLLIYASSYITIVYCTRTFSNSLEVVLFNLLLYLVARSMAESEEIIYHDNVLEGRFKKADSLVDRVRFDRIRKHLPKHSFNHCFLISLFVVAGCFNRPTFAVYAVAPLFFWFQRGIKIQKSFFIPFHTRFFYFTFYSVIIAFFFILFDSWYYAYFTWGEFINGLITWRSFVVTPLNFLRYNLDQKNLSEHGLHPKWLHVLVNVPLLFNVLGVAGFLVIFNLLYRGLRSFWAQLPRAQSITSMMTLSFLTPVLALSYIPHQEPRFIIPILLPLVVLYSHLITRFEEDCPATVRKGGSKFKYLPFLSAFDNRPNIKGRFLTLINNPALKHSVSPHRQFELLSIWFFINIALIVFYGFIHQAGVYGSVKYLKSQLDIQPKYTTYYVFYSDIYPIPEHLLLQPKRIGKVQNLKLMRLSGGFEKNFGKFHLIFKNAEELKKNRKRRYSVFYLLPNSIYEHFHASIQKNFSTTVNELFFPHFSAEAFNFKDFYHSLQLVWLELKLIS